MSLKIFQIDAFTDVLFKGNPAAVVPLAEWLADETLQKIASENNLAETAFFIPSNNEHDYEIRWFTPTVEVNLCGHATLASAYVLFNELGFIGNRVNFNSKSGKLTVTKSNDLLTLDFPLDKPIPADIPTFATEALGAIPSETFKGKLGYTFVFDSENIVKNLNPDLFLLKKIAGVGVIVTAKGESVDFVARFFAPQSGIDEDPVTGSAYTILTPLWTEKLSKTKLTAIQLSSRTGKLRLEAKAERVLISGYAKLYLKGEIFL